VALVILSKATACVPGDFTVVILSEAKNLSSFYPAKTYPSGRSNRRYSASPQDDMALVILSRATACVPPSSQPVILSRAKNLLTIKPNATNFLGNPTAGSFGFASG
jgi:hypothetical protein